MKDETKLVNLYHKWGGQMWYWHKDDAKLYANMIAFEQFARSHHQAVINVILSGRLSEEANWHLFGAVKSEYGLADGKDSPALVAFFTALRNNRDQLTEMIRTQLDWYQRVHGY